MEQLLSIFDVKYTEFSRNLLEAIPELEKDIRAAAALSPTERLARFKAEVLSGLTPTNIATVRTILPGVTLTDHIWTSLGDDGQKAIREFLSVLGVCCSHDSEEWSKEFLNKWKESMASIDFENLAQKMAAAFGGGGTGANFPKFPERLLKGQLAQLADEILREFKPEEFGFTPEMMEEAEKNPAKAFEVITEIYTKNPGALQNIMKRIMKRLQDKIRRGEFKPQEIAKEAEELMKELTDNSSFKELLESLKDSFGFGDAEEGADFFRSAGREGDARRNIVRERLRKKFESKNGQSKGTTKR